MGGANTRQALFMVTRFPRPGRTKTRLIPALGAEGAAQLQRQMTEHLLQKFQPLCHRQGLTFEVHFAGGSTAQMLQWLGPQVNLKPQCQGDLGRRLSHVFDQGFAAGLERILVVGSDCPAIEAAQILQALERLNSHDVVLGPAEDGGYYLVGLRAAQPALFQGVHWGQDCVLHQTVAIAARRRLAVGLLPPLPDIDRPEDLPLWRGYDRDSSSRPQMRS